jgi:hypothetical protein
MEDPVEHLIRRAVRRPAPRLRPTFAEDVLRRVAADVRPAVLPGGMRARRWLAAGGWLAAGAASVAAVAHVEWSSSPRALAWGFGLLLVPMAYSATLWPRRFLDLVALCGGPAAARHDRRRPARGREA